jgi:hypothetical protein
MLHLDDKKTETLDLELASGENGLIPSPLLLLEDYYVSDKSVGLTDCTVTDTDDFVHNF